jgi:LysM repeat protein
LLIGVNHILLQVISDLEFDLKNKHLPMPYRKIILSFLLFFLVAVATNAQTEASKAYVKKFSKVAMDEMRIYKIPASITLAQGILESGSGNSRLSKEGNNHFGIKCGSTWTGKKIRHNDDKRHECFRVYPSPWGSYRDHSKFLTNNKRYSSLFDYKITDYKSWAYGLKKAGYATDKKYPKRLIKIIEDHQLYRFDEMVLNGEEFPQDEIMAIAGPHAVKRHGNRLDYVEAREGDTYQSLSLELGIKQEKLIEYNDKNWDSKIAKGETVYIERKRSHGKNKFYKVKKGDTMYSISQKEGIRLEYLYKRNRIQYGSQPKEGTTLYLRKYKK